MSRKIDKEYLQMANDLITAREMADEIDDDRTIIWIKADEDEDKDDEPRRNFVRVQAECITDGFSDSRIKTLQLAVVRALENNCRRGIPLSDDIISGLFEEFTNLIHGQRTYLFAPQRRRGRPKEPLRHGVDISFAVMYIRAARKGFIDDPNSIKTVLEHFGGGEERGLNKETVEGWLVAEEFESYIPEVGDDFVHLRGQMEFCGAHYVQQFLKATRERKPF
jgi:hypothetical protein